MQSAPKSEAPLFGWETAYLRTLEDGSELMLERRRTSSTSEEWQLTVQCDLGNALGAKRVYQHTWCHTYSGTPEPPTC